MATWTLIAAALILGVASLWTWRRRRRAAPVVASAWAAIGAGLGYWLGLTFLAPGAPAMGLLLGFAGALLGHWGLIGLVKRAEASSEVARRWARAERGARTGELAAALAHEIKNPLTPIRGYARLLLRELDKVDASERQVFEKGLTIIDAEAERIEMRVMRALERARSAVPEAVDVQGLLQEVVGIIEVEASVTRVDLDVQPNLPRLRAFEDGLQGALVNLLENAAEAMREHPGPLEVAAKREGEMISLVIRDRGPGLGDLGTDTLTKAFFTTKETGTGLGLAVARSAIEAMGGEMSLRNREDGEGAEATLRLPIWR